MCIDDDALEAIYFASQDSRQWTAMLGTVGASIGAGDAAFCRDVTRLQGQDALDLSDTGTLQADDYRRAIERGGLATIAETADPCVTLEPEQGGESGYWLLIANVVVEPRAAFVFWRDRDAFTAQQAEGLRIVAPHLFRAARLRDGVAQAVSDASKAKAVLDLLQTPVFLLDARFNVVVRNAAAQELERAGIVQVNRHHLSFPDQAATKRAEHVVSGMAALDHAALTKGQFMRLDRPDGTPLLAVIEPLENLFFERADAPAGVVAALFVKDPERPMNSIEAVMRELHDMPPAEARLAAAIADGKTLKAYATEAGLSEAYVRDLSKRVMHRLGVKRQHQLVRAVLQSTPDIEI